MLLLIWFVAPQNRFVTINMKVNCMCDADASSGVSYGPKYYKTWLPRGLPNITNVDILQHQKPENDAANDPEACSRLYDQTLHIIRKRVGEIETEQKAQKTNPKK